jgi:hypothetical protein|tara:strand:- start:702 stop:1130 length:429 start_codon:yes stop_codon:yes gene_type:complete
MATQSLSVTVSASLSLVDSDGNTVFTFSPSFTTASTTVDSALISTGEILTNGTSDTTINLASHNKDLIYTFIKNVDTDYPVAVKPDGDVIADLKPGECFFSPIHVDGAGDGSANLDLAATTAAQKVQYLICDGPDTGISSDD